MYSSDNNLHHSVNFRSFHNINPVHYNLESKAEYMNWKELNRIINTINRKNLILLNCSILNFVKVFSFIFTPFFKNFQKNLFKLLTLLYDLRLYWGKKSEYLIYFGILLIDINVGNKLIYFKLISWYYSK